MGAQSIRIPVELELKNIQGAINSLKSALSGVSKESGFYKAVGKEIEQVEKKFKELSAIASRPFGSTSAISNFENQFLKLGDKITTIGKSFNDLSFKDLNLQSIPDAEEKFNKLKIEVDKTQKALNAINTNQMKNSLADSTSGLEEAFNKIKNFNKGNSLLNENSFEKTFSALEEKAISLSEKILEAQIRLERLKTANAQTETKLGFFDEAQKKIQEFISGNNLTSEAFANILQPLASQAGMTPERFLDLLGLNKQDLYNGTAEEIQKKLNNAIASKKTNLTNTFSNKQTEIAGLEATIQGFNNYANAVQEAKNKLEELKNSQATQTQLEEAKQKYQEATESLNNFIESCLKMNPTLREAGNGLKVTSDAVNSLPGKTSAARAELDRLNDSANKLSQLKSRLAYFFSFYKVMNTIRNVVREATTTIKELDSVMTKISVVTQMTQKDLWAQMETYSAIANEYAVSIKGVYEISQLYYQQGLQTAQVMELTVETLKMAKIAGLNYATATDYMTVAVRGFKLEMTDAQRVTDVYSALAAKTASSTKEIAVAMSKTASSAEAVGSSFESTSAMIATMIAVTREAPENIGSAMKSIISRYGEMTSDPTKLVDSEGEEMSLNRVDKALQSVGISLQDAQGKFRDFDEVILELAKKWDTIDTNTQRYIATIMAGNRQQSRFLALVGNVEEYSKALEIANTSEDASAQQVLKTMDSIESKLTNVKTAWQQFYTSMGLENLFKGTLDVIIQIINNINKMSKFEAITTIFNIFTALKGLVMGIFTGIVSQFSQLKNFAQEAVTPLQETQKIQVDTSQPQTEFKNLHDLLVEALTQELKIDTTAANGLLEQLGIKVKNVMVPQGTNITQGATYNSQPETFLNAAQKFNWSTIKSLSSFMAAPDKKGYLPGGLTKSQEKALNEVFGEETGLRDAFIADFRNFVGNNKDLEEAFKKNDITTVVETYKQYLTNMTEEERKAYLEKVKRNGEDNRVNEEINKSGGNLATWLDQHAAGARVAAMALQSLGAALTTYALTLKDSSESDREKTKLASGSGSLISGAGSAISGALLGAKAGVPGMIIGAIAAGAPAIISGLSQIIDGIKQTTVEKLANAENELKDLQDEETRKKAKSSSYATALSELEDLKDAQYDSAEAAQAYKDKMNTLAESYPELVTGMDAAGNAIIDIQNLEQLLAEARLTTAQATSEALEKELQIAELDKKRYDEALEGINSVFSGASNYAIQNQSSRKASKDLNEFKNLEEVYDFGQIFSDYSGTAKILDDISNAAYKDGKAQTIELAGRKYKLPDVIRTLKQNDQGQFSFDKGLFKGQQELSLEDQNNLFSAIQSLGEINYNDIYTTSEEFEVLNEELVKDSQYFEEYIAEKAQILKDSNIELKDLYLQDNYDNLMDRYDKALEDGKIEGQEEEALMTEIVDFYNIELPNALSAQIETATEAVKKSVSSLSKKYAQEELAELAIDDSMYREIQEGYSGIFETIGGKLIENEFKAAKSEDSKLTLEDWKKTPEFNSILDSLTNLDLSVYKSIAEIWDNMGAYDPAEFKNALSQIYGLDNNIIDLIVEFYGDSFDYSRELVYNQIQNSKVAKDNKNLKLLTNDIDTFQAPAELMDDINKTIQQADNLYEEGLTARANNLISIADIFYMAATNLSNKDYLDVRSIIDDLDLTNLEELTEAKAMIEALNTENQYRDLLDSIDQAIQNCSQNIDTLAQKIVSETIAAIEKIGEVIDGFENGFEAKDALEAYKKLEGYKGLLEGKGFDYFFEYDDALGKWVYTSQGMSDVIAAQAKEIEVSNKAIDDLIEKSETKVTDLKYDEFNGRQIKASEDYLLEDGTYAQEWEKLNEEEQAYREWASKQRKEDESANVTKQAYLDYLKQQAADGEKAAQLMWEQMIYSLGDTLDFEKIVTGAMGDGRDKDRTLATIEEMIKANGKNLYDQFGNSIAERALLALEEGRFSDYELWTGDQLSSQEVADLVSKKATALNDAVLKAVEAPGTIIDEATYNILNEAGLASHIKWDKQGFGVVTEEAANYVAMINAIASQGNMILEEQNATLATLYEKSFDADKVKTLFDLSSKTSLGFSDLADLATTMGVTMDTFFNEDATDIILSGLDYNKFTGEFDVVDFDAYWETVTGSLDKNTAEYLEARSQWVDNQIEKSNKKSEEAQSELDALLDAKVGDKINVSYLESLVPNIGQYLGTIVDGVATITDGSNLLGLLQYVTQLDAESNILENSVGELRDSIVELIEGWADAIASGLSGELSFSDAESLMSQFGLKDTDFSETKNGLKLSKEAAYELYLQLKQIAPLQSQLVFDSIAESLSEVGSGYEDVASTMQTIAELNRKLADAPVSSERRAELERELAVAEEILRVRSQDPDSFNFMDKDLPTGMQGPENYWNSVGEAYKVMNESAKSGYMEIQDYVNIVNQMEAMAIAAGQEFSIGGMNAAQLIEKGMSSLKNIDGEGVKIAMEGVGIDFANAATDMGLSFDDGVKEVAKSQIKMLDAAIRILEAMVALEELDIDGSGMLEMDEIFINGDPGQGFTRGAQEWLRKINLACGDLKIGGKTLEETMLALAKTNPDKFLDFINQMTNIDWTLGDTNVAAQIENLINTFFPGEIVSMGKSIFDILEIPEDVEETPEKLAKWAESVGLAVGEARALLSNLEYGSTISQDSNQYEAIKKSLGLDKNDQLSQDFDNFYKTITGKGLNTREAIQLWEEITVSDGTEGTKYTYNGVTYNTLDDVLVAKQLKEKEGISGEVSNTTTDTTTGEITSDLSLGQTIITITQSESGTIYRSADGACESTDLRKVIDYEVYQKTKETPGMSRVEAYAEFGIDLTAEGLANVSVEGIKETLSSTAISDAVKKAGGTEDIIISIDGKDVTFAAGTSETEIQQKLMEAIGIDASQVETIVTAISTAISTADWSKVGDAIVTALETNIGQGENGPEAIEIGELTLKPKGLKVDTTDIEPTLSSGEEALSNIPITSLTLTPETLYIDIVNKTPQLKEGQTVTIENIPSATGVVTGSITITNNGDWSAAEGQTSPEVTGYNSANGTVETVTINGSSFKVTPIAGAPTNLDGELNPVESGFVKVEGNYYSVDLSSGTQLNPGMNLSGVTAGSAQVNATSYTVTFTNADGTTSQSVIVQGEAQLNAVLQNATLGDNGGWTLSGISAEVDASISTKSENALVNFFDTLVNKLKNIEVTYQEPTLVGPGPNTSTTGYHVAGIDNNFGNKATIGQYDKLDTSAVENITAQVDNGTFQNGTFEITEIKSDGSTITTSATLAELQAGTVNFSGAVSTPTPSGPKGETTRNQGKSYQTSEPETIVLPPIDTSEMFSSVQKAADSITTRLAMAGETGGAKAASAIQKTLDGIKSKEVKVTVSYPKSVSVGINVTVSGTAPGGGSVSGNFSKPSINASYSTAAKGNTALAKGTLMGELGPELVVSNGRYFLVGQNGAEFVDLADDAIVFNHLQTQRLLKNGHAGTGKPVTNETNAVSFATGNASGPAMASASEALSQLRSIREMWSSLLEATSEELGAKAGSGSGGGGGGGGGSSSDNGAVIEDLERWYNLLRQIEKLEQEITYEQAKRENMISGYDYSDSLQTELELLEDQKAAYEELAKLQKSYYEARVEDLESSDYSKIFTFDENGLMQYTSGNDRGLDILATLYETDSKGKAVLTAKEQINYLESIGFNISDLRYNEDGTKLKSKDYSGMMDNFSANVESWKDEMDDLYDSYNDAATSAEEATTSMNEILDEYKENQLNIEEKLLQAILDREQAEIDRLQEEKDLLEEASQAYIDGLNEALSREKDMYNKNETDEETAKLQRRLAILQRSGGSTSEINSLQEQINSRLKDAYFEEQQNQIDAIQEASDNQLEKLQNQIDIMTESLEYQKENGLFWEEVSTMLNTWTPEKMMEFIETYTESYKSMSALEKQTTSEDTKKQIETYVGQKESEAKDEDWESFYKGIKKNYNKVTQDEFSEKAEETYKSVYDSKGKEAAEEAAKGILNKGQDTVNAREGKGEVTAKKSLIVRASPDKDSKKIGSLKPGVKKRLFAQSGNWYKVFLKKNKKGKSVYGWVSANYIDRYDNAGTLPPYKEGGLIDFTGPAYVHGSKTKPESIISAEHTKLLKEGIFSNSNYSLASTVASLQELVKNISSTGGETNSNVIFENVSINFETGTISNDYDARRAGEMAIEEMMKIARKTTNRIVSR